jgi:hypothetical protein
MTSIALSRPVAMRGSSECTDHRSGTCRYCGVDVLPELPTGTRFKLHVVGACMWALVVCGAGLWLGNSSEPILQAGEPQIESSIAVLEPVARLHHPAKAKSS